MIFETCVSEISSADVIYFLCTDKVEKKTRLDNSLSITPPLLKCNARYSGFATKDAKNVIIR